MKSFDKCLIPQWPGSKASRLPICMSAPYKCQGRNECQSFIFCTSNLTGIAQLVERSKPGAILTRVRVKGIFSQSQLLAWTLLRCPYSPRVQSHVSITVRTLKIPNTGSHTVVWTHKNTTHTDRNEYSADLAAAVPYPGMFTRISCKVVKEVLKHKAETNKN